MRRHPLAAATLALSVLAGATAAQEAPKYIVDPNCPKPLPKVWITGQRG